MRLSSPTIRVITQAWPGSNSCLTNEPFGASRSLWSGGGRSYPISGGRVRPPRLSLIVMPSPDWCPFWQLLENAPVALLGMKNTLDSNAVFQRAVENQKVLETRHAPHAHSGELSFMDLNPTFAVRWSFRPK